MPLQFRWASGGGQVRARRNPGREDRSIWNSSAFISPPDVDRWDRDDETMVADNKIEIQIIKDLPTEDKPKLYRPVMSVSLLDVARPAKAKGTTSTSLFHTF
jgi:hypothetical protein